MSTRDLASLARHINADHARAERGRRTWRAHARRAGAGLIEAKRRAGHGRFMPWVRTHCDFGYDTASLYMRVARDRSANLEHVPTLREAKRLLVRRTRESEPPRRVGDEYLMAVRQFQNAMSRAQAMPERLRPLAKVIFKHHAEVRRALHELEGRLGQTAAA